MLSRRQINTLTAFVLLFAGAGQAQAVDRCNAKFTFTNNHSKTIYVRNSIGIRGNRGDYVEQLNRGRDGWIAIGSGQSVSTRANRLQKVDDGQRANFHIKVSMRGLGPNTNSNESKGVGSNSAGAIGPNSHADRRWLYGRMGVSKMNHTCRDGQFIQFNFRPLPNNATNRQRLQNYRSWNNNPSTTNLLEDGASAMQFYFNAP